jgi:hypothetical protein
MDMSKLSNFGKNISSSFTPFAARTGQFMREQLGQAEDKVHSLFPGGSPSTMVLDVTTLHIPLVTESEGHRGG